MFKKATREKNRLRLALSGASGSGKTYTALRFAFGLAGPAGRVAVIDSERASASKYLNEAPDGIPWHWDKVELEHYAPSTYTQAIKAAGEDGYDVLVIDSLSHAWMGTGGALYQVDQSKAKGGKFAAWRDVTPQHNQMIEAILRCPCHVIVTLRTKMEYGLEEGKDGKKEVVKYGTKPIQREGVEYEFDVICDLDLNHTLKISKTRYSAIDGLIVNKPDAAFLTPIKKWLFDGSDQTVPSKPDAGSDLKSESPVSQESTPPVPKSAAPIQEANADRKDGGTTLTLSVRKPRATKVESQQIRNLCKELGISRDRLKSLLQKKGAQKVSDLSIDDAVALIKKLELKAHQKDAAAAF